MNLQLEKIKKMIDSGDPGLKELGIILLDEFIETKSMHNRLRRYISSLSLTGKDKKRLKYSSTQKSMKIWVENTEKK